MQAELKHEKEQTKSLKRKLNSKEEEIEKIRSDYQQYQKCSRNEIEKLKKDNAALEKSKEDDELRYKNM